MFITTTLGGLALAISVSVTAGTVAGALIRPRLDRARIRIVDSIQQTLHRYRRETAVKSPRSSGGA
jgi:hypothetical protein